MDGRAIAGFGVALVVWALALREAWRAWQPRRLLLAGRYSEAQAAAERLDRSWLRMFAGVRLSSRVAVGCARHLAGDLEGSTATLAPLHEDARVRGNLRYAVCSVDAANRVLLDRDHARATTLLMEAGRIQRSADDTLLAALAALGTGHREEAARLFAVADAQRTMGRQEAAIFHALRGLYLVKVGRVAEAEDDLAAAARSPVASTYVERARAALRAGPLPADDSPSSLEPQVVAKDGVP